MSCGNCQCMILSEQREMRISDLQALSGALSTLT